jgi:alkanesulfonate monooxygenase SsuD/methylene tetrahydromethanopterin reductase-like flavin-dependent oxidoreductase (luciferase family)
MAGGSLPIGVAIGTIGLTAAEWLASVRRLDDAGYRTAWAWDQFIGRGDPTVPVLEQWTILATAAGATQRIGLGTFVTNVIPRHPAVLARMAATLQAASGGRLTVGIGIGGAGRAMAAYGLPDPPVGERVARLEEAVAVLRALWTGGPVTRPGDFYPLADAYAFPIPEPTPDILIGAQSVRGVAMAARVGDGWAAEEPHFGHHRTRYLEGLAAEGRRREDVRIVVGYGGGRTGVDALRGSAWVERPAEAWAELRDRGADEAIVTARTPADIHALVDAVDRW